MNGRVIALQRERVEMLRCCRDLDEAQWTAPSKAAGWRVQDVVAHMGSGCRSVFTLASVKIMRSSDIERTNDSFVDVRRHWTPSQACCARRYFCTLPVGVVGSSVPAGRLGKEFNTE